MGKFKAYVVFKANEGFQIGVYENWAEAKNATNGITGSPQGFKTVEEARRAFEEGDLRHPQRFYVIEGHSEIYHVYDRAVMAAKGLGTNASCVHKFKTQAEADNFASQQQPPVSPVAVDGPPIQLVGEAANRVGRVIVFDTETTGLDTSRDQIVELAISVYDDGTYVRSETFRFRPTDAVMSPGAQAVHGITMEMLADQPTFANRAQEIYDTFLTANCLIGYNVSFDIRMIREEFNRAGLDPLHWRNYCILDPYLIWTSHERRSLSGAHRRFVGQEIQDAHNATNDVYATARVYNAMINNFGMDTDTPEAISAFIWGRKVDLDGKFVWDENGTVVFNFGGHKDEPVCEEDNYDYLEWMLRNTFPEDTNRVAEMAMQNIHDQEEFHRLLRLEFGDPPQD